jgi:hypothetical protein
VIPAKAELMRLVFMVLRFLVGFIELDFLSQVTNLAGRRGNAYRTLGLCVLQPFHGFVYLPKLNRLERPFRSNATSD